MIHVDYDLTPYNSLRLPATAAAFARFHSVAELNEQLTWAKQRNLVVKILGAGSNVLLAGRVDALVLQSAMTHIEPLLASETAQRVAVDAGVEWHYWVEQSTHYGSGLENLALIPGTVGAAPVQNIGAYGVEVANFIEAVEGILIGSGTELRLDAEHCQFGYRDSIFKRSLAGDFIITRVIFQLPFAFSPNLSYGPLATLDVETLTGAELIAAVCAIRNSKLPNPAVIPNAGSFFKNPLVSNDQLQQLISHYPNLPHHPQPSGQQKLAAGWLIEQAGFKGQWHGNVRMHDQQALVLTTNGQASFAEVMQLANAVVTAVDTQFGVHLEPEPQVF